RRRVHCPANSWSPLKRSFKNLLLIKTRSKFLNASFDRCSTLRVCKFCILPSPQRSIILFAETCQPASFVLRPGGIHGRSLPSLGRGLRLRLPGSALLCELLGAKDAFLSL